MPHIIEVDRLGAASYHGPVGQADYVPTDAVITYHLRRFIEDTREISSDLAVLKRNWLDAYTLLTPRGGRMLSAFVQKPENDPFRRAQDERVTVEVLSTVRVAGRHVAGRLARVVLGQERRAHRRPARLARDAAHASCRRPRPPRR